MSKERIIELIQKVLAKANNNSNEHEVEVAMMKAQEMMIKHGLTMEDVSEEDEPVKKEVVYEGITDHGRTSWWWGHLSIVVADNFRCKSVRRTRSGKSHLRFIGLKEDVTIAREIFQYAKAMIEILSKQYVAKLVNKENDELVLTGSNSKGKFTNSRDFNAEKNDYIRGFIDGVEAKFKEQVEKNNWGLVILKDEAVVQYIEDMNLKAGRSSSFQTSGNENHFNKGYADGKSFDHNRKVIG